MEQKRFNLIEHFRNVSNLISSQYQLSSAYGHRGSKGSIREDLISDALQSIVNDYVMLCKGEICDSNGLRSPEFDIIAYHKSSAVKLFSTPKNKVIPIETVLAILEVKSILNRDGFVKFNDDLSCLNTFDRFYEPTSLYKHQGDLTGQKEYEKFIGHSIKPFQKLHGISPVIGGIVCFESPQTETVKEWIKDVPTESNFIFIVALNEWIASCNPENKTWRFAPIGPDCFASFAYLITGLFQRTNERELHLSVDSNRYFELAAKDVPKID